MSVSREKPQERLFLCGLKRSAKQLIKPPERLKTSGIRDTGHFAYNFIYTCTEYM